MNTDKNRVKLAPGFISTARNAQVVPNVLSRTMVQEPQSRDAWLARQKQIKSLDNYKGAAARIDITKPRISDKFSGATVYGAMILVGTIYMLVKYHTLVPTFLQQ